jgi:DNA-binding response OmpR family regulator
MAKILIVDHDRDMATRVAQGLTQAGHTCAVRMRGRDALNIIENEALDLVLIDPMLSDVSGFEICRRVRRASELFHLPIVFFSAMSNPEEIQHALAQGADDFVPKPSDLGQIVQRVNSLLADAQSDAYVDPVTGLPDNDETRRRVQLRITRGDSFALLYAELLGVRRLTQEKGAAARDKALRHLGRALSLTSEGFKDDTYFGGHMGGGFFLCILQPDEVAEFGSKLLKSWRKHQGALRETLGYPATETGPNTSSDFLDLIICSTTKAEGATSSAQELLDTLSRIRRSLPQETGGIHLDRRH